MSNENEPKSDMDVMAEEFRRLEERWERRVEILERKIDTLGTLLELKLTSPGRRLERLDHIEDLGKLRGKAVDRNTQQCETNADNIARICDRCTKIEASAQVQANLLNAHELRLDRIYEDVGIDPEYRNDEDEAMFTILGHLQERLDRLEGSDG